MTTTLVTVVLVLWLTCEAVKLVVNVAKIVKK
jgi:hypothetical protein